ncbi:poly-beta-hydroxybutyrate-responsive repressor [Neobacillus cucumis]|uniref:poly-beta-hydroxybutyrate-responsive repressor n=1 Tax=Neobacillus cucumis TaxID=1740721 RepID=UPI001965E4D0|nr:poly-beta-hydroxybutyrate-responsive repressor [Neobacillus cucumis]MBM7654208.1 poly-beta-hydroxybutyrate-responsive repressor [Neobacillus cucumis]MDR4946160.1 poly-beta-hydroxybutyrate-responsive repressor [Neobacillus cucumis]MED4223982.1 poly-beta-hydroxybutyrate-responsive repressor [Neobacillus cucumis]
MVNQDNQSVNPSKNFVLPFILLLLSKVSLHGYELSQKLETFGFKALDQGNLYRMLRQLEKDELVSSEWDTTGSGPAKRRYSTTKAGITYLKGYANQLETYQSILDQFFKMYSSILELYIPSFQKKDPIEKVNNSKRRKNHGSEEE